MPGRHGHYHVHARLLIYCATGSLIFEHAKMIDPLNIFWGVLKLPFEKSEELCLINFEDP